MTISIQLRNSLTGAKEAFAPIDPANVRMYVCGPTVYDRAHIGNARPAVAFDVLYRLLRHVYGPDHVTYVRNITDVDDKIMARAEARGVPIADITAETCDWYQEDMAAVGNLAPNAQPRATEYIPQMQAMISRLIEQGHAYAAEGHVLFSVDSFEAYGRLSGRSVDDMIAGARVEVAPFKKNPMDFVLWKPSAEDQQGWDSPWGRGRPGWHIECSAMSEETLGADFDIHGGGSDLMFPHHENEIAQSCCANPGSGFARVWLHNGMIRIGGQKMSKSLGNFTTVHDLRETVPGDVIRLALLSSHYRGELDWTVKLVEDCEKALLRWRRAIAAHVDAVFDMSGLRDLTVDARVIELLCDDLNFPGARARFDELATAARKGDADAAKLLAASMTFVGFDPELSASAVDAPGAREALLENDAPEASARIEALLAERVAARKAKDFARSDAIRDGLKAAGVEVKDTPQGAEFSLSPDFDSSKLEDL